ncbi:Uncharacterised protein [Pasteurella multocida]|nr:Uncharacterised protein [Pasteurella multocida]
MKWFEKAIGKEKIIHMFNGELTLNNVILNTFCCYDYKLDISIYLLELPNSFPIAWDKNVFNSIKVVLEFFNLLEVKLYADNLYNLRGGVDLKFLDDKVEFNLINDKGVVLYSCSDVVRIAEIKPVKISNI